MALKHFDGNKVVGRSGKEYTITESLSVRRWMEFEKYQLELYYGRNATDVFQSQKKVHELLNAGKVADATIENWNNMNGIAKIADKKNHAAMYICTLFINESGENMGEFSESAADVKIEDWSEYDIKDFFLLARTLVPNFMEDYAETTHTITQPEKAKEKKENPELK